MRINKKQIAPLVVILASLGGYAYAIGWEKVWNKLGYGPMIAFLFAVGMVIILIVSLLLFIRLRDKRINKE